MTIEVMTLITGISVTLGIVSTLINLRRNNRVDTKATIIETATLNNKIDNVLGRKYLLCTDGLTGTSSDEEIFDIIKNSEKEKICANLINMANDKGGIDNTTVMYIEV